MRPGLSIRAARPDEDEFLFRVYVDALGPHLVSIDPTWSAAGARAAFFERLRPDTHDVVELDHEPIGCLFVERLADRLKLNRVLLCPVWQGQGIGTEITQHVLLEAEEAGLPVTLRVLRGNTARCLYLRLGFEVVGATETHWLMRHAAGSGEDLRRNRDVPERAEGER